MTAMQATITTLTTQLSDVNNKLVESLNLCTTLKELLAARNNSGGNGRGREVTATEVVEVVGEERLHRNLSIIVGHTVLTAGTRL